MPENSHLHIVMRMSVKVYFNPPALGDSESQMEIYSWGKICRRWFGVTNSQILQLVTTFTIVENHYVELKYLERPWKIWRDSLLKSSHIPCILQSYQDLIKVSLLICW